MTATTTARPTVVTGLPRLLTGDPTLRDHLQRHGALPWRGGRGMLIATIEQAGLTGRGGAAFPLHRKLSAVLDGGGRPVVVGNGAEGEPASSKDKTLLWHQPHLVLDGLQLVAEAIGSREVHLYVHRFPELEARIAEALRERRTAGIDRVAVTVTSAPARFLAGEESALASRISGGQALPRFTPPRVFEKGVHGAPTLVSNVETLAHVALIARHGADWFRSLGTADEPGSMLTTLHLADGTTEVRETELGTPLRDLLQLDVLPVRAVLVGGYHGAWLSLKQAQSLRIANADLRPLGAAVGAGVLAALPADLCGLVESARVMRYLALESAGQCGPCLNGLPRIANTLATLATPPTETPGRNGACRTAFSPSVSEGRPQAYADLLRWAGLVEKRGACHHPDGSVRFLRSALTVFADEVQLHSHGGCSATSRAAFLPIPASAPSDDSDWA